MEGARFLLVPLLVVLAGCRGKAPPPVEIQAPAPSAYVPSPSSANAFDAYVIAASEAEAAAASLAYSPLSRTFFSPRQRETLLRALGPALRRIARAKGACDFKYTPVEPGRPLPYRAAWRLLGRALRWRIDDDLAKPSAQEAVDDAATAFRFANDLCGGGPADRTLGVEIAEDARLALLPALAKLDKAGLHRLADATKAGLSRRPPLEQTLKNADEDMAVALRSLQRAMRDKDYAALRADLGREFRDLDSLDDLSDEKRAKLIAGLDADRNRLSAAWHAAATLPATRREKILKVRLAGDKTQRAFARHFFLIGRPLLSVEDRSLARLRLLVLEAELRRVVLLKGRAPASLEAVRPPWATDPYTGRPLGYQPDGAEFRVYSVGANLKDDLGDTDEAGLDPDIRTVLP